MDSASLTSLTPLLDDIDKWVELAPLLPVLISLELTLSADNAIALASITSRLDSKDQQSLALNIGISLSLGLRILLILTAQYVLQFWPIKLLAGIYLLSLFYNKVLEKRDQSDSDAKGNSINQITLIRTIILLAITDLAFSIDSVAAAVAISDQFLLVITGAIIGVIALRFTSGLFIIWLEEFTRLEMAGYITVGLVGLKLILLLCIPSLNIPEWTIFISMLLIFAWGFSKKKITDRKIS